MISVEYPLPPEEHLFQAAALPIYLQSLDLTQTLCPALADLQAEALSDAHAKYRGGQEHAQK